MTHLPDPNKPPTAQPDERHNEPTTGGKRKKRAKKKAALPQPPIDPTSAELLARCAVNLTEQAQQGKLRRAYGRIPTIESIWQLLRDDSTRKPLLLGKARSGKTALAYEIACRIAEGDCPAELRQLTIYETSPASLTTALQFGAGWREHLNRMLQGLGEAGNVLIFLRDTHNAVGAGQQGDDEESDLAKALVSTLRTSKLRWLAEARADTWRVTASADATFAECFAPVLLNELSPDETRTILATATPALVGTPPVAIQPGALEAVLDIAARFLLNQALPGKAIDVLEDALRFSRRNQAATLAADDVIAAFVERSGLARLLLDDSVPFHETEVQRYFAERVLGQAPANAAVVQAIALLKARLNDPARPMGVFLFLGPTGVGKTELAKTLCAFLFGTEERLLRFNMADFAFYWQYEELFGDPDADDLANRRGLLSRRLASEPFGVVLLDEFEKAHEMIFQRFLQVFDEGLLVNPAGEEINLRNMVLIMTSNFGAQLLQGEPWGLIDRNDIDAAERRIMRETESFFTPEFINRLDSVIFFKPLSLADMRQIAYRELRKLFTREGLTRRGISIELDDSVVDLLLRHGYSTRYGARYLKRQIEKRISYPLARAILSHPAGPGEHSIRLYARADHIEAAWVREISDEQTVALDNGTTGPSPAALAESVAALKTRLAAYLERIELPEARQRMDALLADLSGPVFWDDGRAAEARLAELSAISQRVDRGQELRQSLDELQALAAQVATHHERRLMQQAGQLQAQLERELAFAELEDLFSTPQEWGNAYLVIATAPGDTQAPRWAGQLIDMYSAWAAQHRLSCTLVDETPESSGEWRVTLAVEGRGAYGLLQSERGTHRFSEAPQAGESRRKQVAQVRVEVLPAIDERTLRLSGRDLVIDAQPLHERGLRLRRLRGTARASHVPTGLTISVTTAEDPAAAAALATSLLRSRLFLARSGHNDGLEAEAPWGALARAYQLTRHPTVKDPRTGVQHAQPAAVFAGDLDGFIAGYLQKRRAMQSAMG